TPMGDFVIVTLEGDDPGQAFGQLMGAKDAFTTWFIGRAKAIHGLDPSAVSSAPPPELVIDTEQAAVLATYPGSAAPEAARFGGRPSPCAGSRCSATPFAPRISAACP